MKNVLLTGANGLLGQKLVYALKSRNDIELLATGIGQNRLIDQANYSFQSLDITNKTEVDLSFQSNNFDIESAPITKQFL